MGTIAASNLMNPGTVAAFNQVITDVQLLVRDFDQTLNQVLASRTVQQFISNEAHMIQVLATDLAQIHMLGSPMGRMMG
jgi:hypothetical protein